MVVKIKKIIEILFIPMFLILSLLIMGAHLQVCYSGGSAMVVAEGKDLWP